MITAALALALAVAAGEPEWLVFEQFTGDAVCTTAHDRVSGAFVRSCSNDAFERIVARHKGRPSRTEEHALPGVLLKVLEFDWLEPSDEVRRLVTDVTGGREPAPGSHVAAFLATRTPSTTCNAELIMLGMHGDRSMTAQAVVCSPQQRVRVIAFLTSLLRGERYVTIRDGNASKKCSVPAASLGTIAAGTPVARVIEKLGPPSGLVWPLLPEGFTILCETDDPSAIQVAIDFTKDRRVKGTRSLLRND
jgi:hypothetical protein